MQKISIDVIVHFLNSRNSREKLMIVVGAVLALAAIDNFLLIMPSAHSFLTTGPRLATLKRDLQTLKEDRRNEALIQKNWEETKATLAQSEKSLISANELPTLLENLSQLAQNTGVKIISLNPREELSLKNTKPAIYPIIPIDLRAVAGLHELGAFLSKLEGGQTFFRVADIKISVNPSHLTQHSVELRLETYRKI